MRVLMVTWMPVSGDDKMTTSLSIAPGFQLANTQALSYLAKGASCIVRA